ncbi:signal peptidase I [Parapedobacter koreensis]|uniref:Signal peptidase I n=1 Tax=Parapedobacter koreensis TaxID=332977 RepID=A0A1H7F7L9_9SPHI|nr:signal peptidase I [Parapedobacter koreensis]SEK19990.1 signal peptidase I [Parapedobacter koreensis]
MGVWLRKIWKTSRGIALTAIFTVLVVGSLRIFLFASFSIPTPSMQPTILPGDHILINKLVPGPRMDWLCNAADVSDNHRYRIKGHRPVTRGDVLVFNAPYHLSDKIAKNWEIYYVKRCMGVPGDTLQIKENAYWIKNKAGAFKVSVPANKLVDAWMDSQKPDRFKELDWTLASLGPAYIPREGDKIRLDSVNIYLYENLIEYETGGEVSFSANRCYLDGKPYPYHSFRQNYYFMAGDYAVDSEDSRYWGLLPEDHIVGKAAYIWRSTDPDTKKYRFDRFFKPL